MSSRKPRGERDYIYARGGVFYLRFQYPPALRQSACEYYGREEWPPEEARSLGTKNRVEAEAKAAPYIARHKALLLYHAARTDPDKRWGEFSQVWQMEPNTTTTLGDGTLLVANETHIMRVKDGKVVSTEPNRMRGVVLLDRAAVENEPAYIEAQRAQDNLRRTLVRDYDAEMIETYLDGRFGPCAPGTAKRPRPDKGDVALVRSTLEAWRAHSGGKHLKDANRQEVAAFIRTEIDNRATPDKPLAGLERVKKGVKFLIAAINNDIEDRARSRFAHNPFANPNWEIYDRDYVPGRKPVPFSEEDIRAIKANATVFSREEYLMVAMHCATSVRPRGLSSITRDEWVEEAEHDTEARLVALHRNRVFYVETDKDAVYGKRRLPLPEALLKATWVDGSPLLPPVIQGPLFPTDRTVLNREINEKLRRIGVATDDPLKRLYSGRHRARQRMNACNHDQIRRYIMGHSHERDPHDTYGGYRAFEVKRWIDIIGF
ncbi:DUF6538 domain-containing protein [Methylobacterium sp. 22177]|uniref:DUF6538 domain-containing protein n=1 Tax=Methylobacterium sp. 22177 TaxID=3453885 RepID=UPI003F877FAE